MAHKTHTHTHAKHTHTHKTREYASQFPYDDVPSAVPQTSTHYRSSCFNGQLPRLTSNREPPGKHPVWLPVDDKSAATHTHTHTHAHAHAHTHTHTHTHKHTQSHCNTGCFAAGSPPAPQCSRGCILFPETQLCDCIGTQKSWHTAVLIVDYMVYIAHRLQWHWMECTETVSSLIPLEMYIWTNSTFLF